MSKLNATNKVKTQEEIEDEIQESRARQRERGFKMSLVGLLLGTVTVLICLKLFIRDDLGIMSKQLIGQDLSNHQLEMYLAGGIVGAIGGFTAAYRAEGEV
jgi:hypothetical protein